jgi:hypothetical protein
MKKVILVGLLAGLVMFVIGFGLEFGINAMLPSLKAQYENPNLFRSWSDPLMSLIFIEPFILGIILALIYNKIKDSIKSETLVKKGIYFGLFYWLLAIPGMIMSYSSFPISFLMVSVWTVNILIQSVFAGMIFSKMIR